MTPADFAILTLCVGAISFSVAMLLGMAPMDDDDTKWNSDSDSDFPHIDPWEDPDNAEDLESFAAAYVAPYADPENQQFREVIEGGYAATSDF